jgi:hypothetical protein
MGKIKLFGKAFSRGFMTSIRFNSLTYLREALDFLIQFLILNLAYLNNLKLIKNQESRQFKAA